MVTIYFLPLCICLFWIINIKGVIQYISFCDWHHSLNNVFKVHPCWSWCQYIILFYCQTSISLYGYTTFCLSFTINGWLNCFYFLVIINNVDIYVLYFGGICFYFLGIYLRMDFLGHVVSVCLTFKKTNSLFSKVEASYQPSAILESIKFSITSLTLLLADFLF